MTRFGWLLLLAAYATGCSRERALSGAEARDAGNPDLVDASKVDLARDPDAATPPLCPRADVAPTSNVHVQVRNDAATDRLVAREDGPEYGWCTSVGIARADGTVVATRPGFECGCECPNPGPASATRYTRLRPGESLELVAWDGRATWDGRGVQTCSKQVDCSQEGWPNGPVIAVTNMWLEPLAPGAYHATVAVERSPPSSCSSSDGITYDCMRAAGLGWPGTTLQRCPSTEVAGADFTLPASGSVDVLVSIH